MSSARLRCPPAGIRSACCCPCRSQPQAPARASVASTAQGERNNRWRQGFRSESPDPPVCRPAIARSAIDQAPRPLRWCRRSAWRSVLATAAEDRSPEPPFSSVWQGRYAPRKVAGPYRSVAGKQPASHAASVASAGAANCDEISPWNTDGPTWSSRLSRSAHISPPISVQRLQKAKSSLR